MLARLIFSIVDFGARKGQSSPTAPGAPSDGALSAKLRARRTGVRGETYAYWHLRRHGYTLIARNFTTHGIKGEIDMVGYDGSVLAFVEVKTRTMPELLAATSSQTLQRTPEDAVHWEKRRNLSRMARQFLRARHLETAECRFDVLAIETRPGAKPLVRLHKGAFNAESN
jgi:putative endonuclease